MATAGATTTMKMFGLGGFTLNFIIESGTFNAFLHEEANQLIIKTLRCARRYLTCEEVKYLHKRAGKNVSGPGKDNFERWGWTNPFNQETFAWVFMETERLMKMLEPGC